MSEPPVQALSGLRVLDLSDRLSGAFCARMFGDHGADVVMIEGEAGHSLRHERPFLHGEPGLDRSLLHAYANYNKRSAALREADPRRAQLAARADVIIVTEIAAEARARDESTEAVIVACTPYGLSGPKAGLPGNDLTAFALSSWASSNGDLGEPPLKGSSNQVGYLTGITAFVGALAALHERATSDRGQTVDVSELEALTLPAGPSLLSASYEGAPTVRSIPDVFSGPVPVRDGNVSVTFSRAHFWRDAMNALGLEELAEDPRYIDSATRRQYRDDLAPRIEAQLMQYDRWDIFERLSLLRCVCGVVLDMADLDENEHLNERCLFAQTTVDGEAVRVAGAPFKMSATPWAFHRPAPTLAEHTDEVVEAWLGGSA